MATTKQAARKPSTTKKTAPKKTAVAKSSSPKKAPVKKNATKKTSVSELRSFKIAKDDPPFRSFKISRQTVYWLVLVCFIIFAQLWIIKLQIDVANLIELQQNELVNTNY
jgi:hypothetical protein